LATKKAAFTFFCFVWIPVRYGPVEEVVEVLVHHQVVQRRLQQVHDVALQTVKAVS
jgi:hypothetical protein